MRSLRATCGVAIWVLIALGLWSAWSEEDAAAKPDQVAADVWTYYAGDYQPATLKMPEAVDLAVGDPIFSIDAAGNIKRIGEVRGLLFDDQPTRRAYVNSAQAMFYPDAPDFAALAATASSTTSSAANASLAPRVEYYSTDQSLVGAMQMMFPAEKRKEIARLIMAAYEEHNEQIAEDLWPIVHATLKETVLALEKELAISFAQHRDELRAIGAKYQQEIIADDVIPLVREVVWPIARERGEPMANQIGKEIWERVSLWRFGWRMVYDRTPLLPTRNYTEKEWQRFVDAEIVPVLERHTEDMVQVTQSILRDVGRNSEVRQALRKNLTTMLDDPDLQRVIGAIVKEVVIERDSLRATFRKHWSTPESQQALRMVSAKLEPTAKEIGELIVGTPQEISPEFAMVLRNYALAKDRRWIFVFVDETHSDHVPATANNSLRPTAKAGELTLNVALGASIEVNPFASLIERPDR